MNFEKVRKQKRKAISPVLATVILIAITLIAAVAIAGFVFGLFGSFTSSATLSVSSSQVVCTGTGPWTCAVHVVNTGSTQGTIVSAGPTTGSVTFALKNTTVTAVPGNSNGLIFYVIATGGSAGQSVQGYLVTSNANLNFVATL
jgi:archaeal type IV pilus assembly protein PilA